VRLWASALCSLPFAQAALNESDVMSASDVYLHCHQRAESEIAEDFRQLAFRPA
jgi:hypothetical protein